MPGALLPLLVTNPASIRRIQELHSKGEALVAVAMRTPGDLHQATWDNLHPVGCIGRITKLTETESGELSIMLKGQDKARLKRKVNEKPRLTAEVETVTDNLTPNREALALAHASRRILEQMATLSYHGMESIIANLAKIKDPLILFSTCATSLPFAAEKKQQILELDTLAAKFDLLYKTLKEELDILELSSSISAKAKSEISSAQREYYLRQQMKTIKKELGEGADSESELDELTREIQAKNLPEVVQTEVNKDLRRLERMQPGASEYVTIRTYLDWIIDLPWNEASEDNLEIDAVETTLDADHFNLKKPKRRILEFLAVKKLKGELKGPILCLVGPPGVGKTSLGKSIAHAMNRQFVRISLGGVRDEAEIRGHRRTYIGAMPGRIISGIKQAGTVNPVFMLDEIDKLGKDVHGDPAAALLEALDPEQNNSFVDHYLNVPFDLSQVFFITTANVIDDIPHALRDRLEIVEIDGYTQEDKLKIARDYLLPKELDANGLSDLSTNFSDAAIKELIRAYTRESGVRSLQRQIAAVLRAIAAKVARGQDGPEEVDCAFVGEVLGPARFSPETRQRISLPGVATGLAWTPFGGEILFIEAALIESRDEMILTGQMGDVMKESARIALSVVKSLGFNLPEGKTLHIHLPAGAIPKDGPSAGITLVTSIISLLTGHTVRQDLAMTGEITLRGVVLPVGGVGEKILAAKRTGIDQIILPKPNEKDLHELDAEARAGQTFHPVETIDEVLKLALPELDLPTGLFVAEGPTGLASAAAASQTV